jgi:hypothetical protein
MFQALPEMFSKKKKKVFPIIKKVIDDPLMPP